MLHMIDCYLGVEADVNFEPLRPYRGYHRAFEFSLSLPMDPTCQVIGEAEINFHPKTASNRYNVMNVWNRMAPKLRNNRQRTQAVTFVLDAIRN
jgi:hypothetical protein